MHWRRLPGMTPCVIAASQKCVATKRCRYISVQADAASLPRRHMCSLHGHALLILGICQCPVYNRKIAHLEVLWGDVLDVVAVRLEAPHVALPVQVHARRKRLVVEGEVDEEAALRQQRHQEPCTQKPVSGIA